MKKRNQKRKLITPTRKKGRKQIHPAKAHYQILRKKMNWPNFWPTQVSTSSPTAHSTSILRQDNHRNTLLTVRVHMKRRMMRKKKKGNHRNILLIARMHLRR